MKKLFLTTVAVATLLSGASFAAELKFKPGEDSKFNWKSYEAFKTANSSLKGETLTIFGPWRGEDEALFQSVLAYFADATGVNVRYSSSENYEQQIVIDTQAGSPPNVAILPQPGLLADLAAKGLLTPLGDETANWVKENYGAGQSWVDLGMYKNKDGNKAISPSRSRPTSSRWFWYVPENFEEAGYKVPETMEDLVKLSDRSSRWRHAMVHRSRLWWRDGWPATDWVEDFMLRTQPLDVYQKWTTNEVKFNDPRVVAAIEEFGKFARTTCMFSGGVAAVAYTDFRDSPKGLFDIPPKCYLHRQASFIPSSSQRERRSERMLTFSTCRPSPPRPISASRFWVLERSLPSTRIPRLRVLVEFLKTPIAHEVWMAQSGFLTPFKGVNTDAYANDQVKRQGEILTTATTFGFDGSDLMPGKIGAGAFWTGMVDFVGGKSAEQVANDIQKAGTA